MISVGESHRIFCTVLLCSELNVFFSGIELSLSWHVVTFSESFEEEKIPFEQISYGPA